MTEMHNEVVDAVVEHYKGADEDIAADCLVYLSSLKCLPLAVQAQAQLSEYHTVHYPTYVPSLYGISQFGQYTSVNVS